MANPAVDVSTVCSSDFDKNERRRRILLRNAVLVFVGYSITQLATLAARLLGLSSVRYSEIVFVSCFTLASSASFYLATRFKKTISVAYVRLFHFGQYLIWLGMYAVWVLTLREIRVMPLFCAIMALMFMLADTKMWQSYTIAASAFFIQIVASHYAIYKLGQPGVFKLEVYYAFVFAPAASFLSYLAGSFSKQRQEVRLAKRSAEESRDALTLEIERSLQTNADLGKANDGLALAMQKIEEMARVDSLTNLFNRRHLMDCLELARKRYSRVHQRFSVVIVDIDFFKKINDTYGHLQGDSVLRAVAQALQRTLRETDICARYGGEEFMLLLEQTKAEQAVKCAERLRVIVERERFAGLDASFSVTISIGVAEYSDGETIEQTIGRADAALYRAKQGGRNRVELAEAVSASVMEG